MTINLGSLSGGMAIGQDGSGRMRAALDGQVALRRDDGGYVAVDDMGRPRDVSGYVFEGSEQFIYRMPLPVVDVTAGDLIVLCDAPLRVLAVKEVTKAGHVRGIDLTDNTVTEWVPPVNAPVVIRLINLAQSHGGHSKQGEVPGIDPEMLMMLGSRGSTNVNMNDLLLLRALGAVPARKQISSNRAGRSNGSSPSRGGELAMDMLSDLWSFARERGFGRPRRGRLFRGLIRPRR